MVRHRKIPVRKHHGVRDPLKQGEEREKKLKHITNNPPEKGSEEKVSHRVAQLKKLIEDTKAGRKLKKRIGIEDLPKDPKAQKAQSESKKIRHIKQLVGEADEDYLRRVNRLTTESLREAQYEAKYGVQVIRNPSTGEITIKKKPKNEIDELLKQKLQEKRMKKSKKKNPTTENAKPLDPKVAKELIKQAIREDTKEKQGPQEFQRDVVKFGEVVHGPPTLSVLPRKAVKDDTVPRPGKKNSLLLKSLLCEPGTASKSKPIALKDKATTKAKLKGKRKDLPIATRKMLEEERNKIVEIYRKLKKSKQSQIQQ